MNIDETVALYRQLREKKKQLKKQYEEKVERIDSAMRKIEVALLKFMEESGVESVKTADGTAYLNTIKRASVKDWEALVEWVRENERWDVLTKGVSKTAVLDVLEDEGALPPGVDLYVERTVNVRG